MRLLALETSGTSGSIALWMGEPKREPTQWALPSEVRSARSLAPTIQKALKEVGWTARDLELIAVTTGPGSFTGLRVGVVTAKTLAFALRCPVIGVNTLEIIARQGFLNGRQTITAVIDAQRSELFIAKWSCNRSASSTSYVEVQATSIMTADTWLASLRPGEWVTGPGLKALAARIPSQVRVVDEPHWQPQAATVAITGLERYRACKDRSAFDPFVLLPQYFRRTAAEEQWEQRGSGRTAD